MDLSIEQASPFSILARRSSFPSMVIPTNALNNTTPSSQDQLIYLSLLASYHRVFAPEQTPTFDSLRKDSIGYAETPVSPPLTPLQGSCPLLRDDARSENSGESSARVHNAQSSPPKNKLRSKSPPPPPSAVLAAESEAAANRPIALMNFEEYLTDVERRLGVAEDQEDGRGGGSIRQCKSGRKRSPSEPTDPSARRDRTLRAARRCRLRKLLRTHWLEARCSWLQERNDDVARRIQAAEDELAMRTEGSTGAGASDTFGAQKM
ncbi:hypothetical protein M427DRAFT_134733 [Gonapodya prolifera JEL478]|uniref:BZIP domain-containing protein n=1 Tax=Gonapodya prolifera (strain JEL478) TaxID=1344416 RepID=A0A139AHP6_GONPJ|nr:hypothetical protein M427DRAFT_134733 [Gonapodya prolifera JEL478]|eukprot:KXS15933.1 hypothetical protein M427DRAFT_134733 [Gonapodya prolifera JEL478]